MSSFDLNQNLVSTEPSLYDVLSAFRKDLLLNLNCHHIGMIKSFDPITQTATATINYKKTLATKDGQKFQDYPVLLDCPVVCLGGGLASLTFPITIGDECLVLFNDRDIDNWFSGAIGGPVASPALHSFSDGIILVGVRSLARSIPDYDLERAALRNGTAMVAVNLTQVKVANALYTLNDLLQELITEVQNLVTATAAITVTGITSGGSVSGPPANAAVIAAINTAITTTATKIGVLLE